MKLSLKLLHAEFACKYDGTHYVQSGAATPLLSSSSIITPALKASVDVIYVHVPSICTTSLPKGTSVVTSRRYADCFDGCNLIIVPNNTDLLELPAFLASLFSRYFSWSDSLYDAITRNCDLQTLIDLTVPMVNEPMYFADSSWKMVAHYSSEMEYINPTWSYQMKYSYLPYSVYSEIIEADEMRIYRNEPHAFYCAHRPGFPSFPFISKAIRKDGKHYGNFFIIELSRKLDARDFEIAEHLGNLVATALYGESDYLASSALYSSHFIIDVIEGALTSNSLITDQLHALGWNNSGEYVMSFIAAQDSDAAILNHIMFLVNSISDNVISFSYGDGIVSIFNDYSTNGKRIRTHLASLARDFNSIVALSNSFSQFTGARNAYQEVSFLGNFGCSNKLEGKLISFSDYFFDYMAEKTASALMFRDKVSVLQKHDEEHGTEFCNTLYQWLLFERNTVKASQVLYVHRNTLKNRLNFTEKLLNLDLEKPEIRLQLLVSLHRVCAKP